MRNARGFTLIEMMVSLSIFGVMAAVMLASYRSGSIVDEMRTASQLAASAVRQAQTRSMAGSVISVCRRGAEIPPQLCSFGCDGGECANEVPYAYGVRFRSTGDGSREAVIFADLADSTGAANMTMDATEVIQSTKLSSTGRSYVKSLSPSLGDRLEIVFVPPRPSIYFNNSEADNLAIIEFGHEADDTDTRKLRVNRISGQVSAD